MDLAMQQIKSNLSSEKNNLKDGFYEGLTGERRL